MSKKIFFIVLTCCLLVATFCVSFAGVPQVQCAPANVRAVLDRPDCLAAPLIVPPVVEPPLMDFVVPDSMVGTWYLDYSLLDSVSVGGFNMYSTVDEPVFSLQYDGDSYVAYTLSIVGSADSPFVEFALDFDGYDTLVITSSITFSVISSSANMFWNDSGEDVLLSPSFVLDAFPDGFLTRVPEPFSGVEITGDIVDILVSGIVGVGESLGSSFSTLAESIFINADGTGLSMFGTLVVCFSGVSLCLSLTRWVLNFCSSLGKRNR